MADYYALLGVAPTASAAEIRQSYLRLARDRHPDRFADPAEKQRAQHAFQELTTAFNTLVNPRSRAEYDEERLRPRPTTAAEIARDAFERATPLLAGGGGLQEAITLLRTAVHNAPDEPAYHAALGRALSAIPGAAREAVAELEHATKLAPRGAQAFADLASVLASHGMKLRAQKALEVARRLAPGDERIARLASELDLS